MMTGLRFVLDPGEGDGGFLIWNTEVIPAIIDWLDPVVQHGLRHRIKYVRLIRRKASIPAAQGTDTRRQSLLCAIDLRGPRVQQAQA